MKKKVINTPNYKRRRNYKSLKIKYDKSNLPTVKKVEQLQKKAIKNALTIGRDEKEVKLINKHYEAIKKNLSSGTKHGKTRAFKLLTGEQSQNLGYGAVRQDVKTGEYEIRYFDVKRDEYTKPFRSNRLPYNERFIKKLKNQGLIRKNLNVNVYKGRKNLIDPLSLKNYQDFHRIISAMGGPKSALEIYPDDILRLIRTWGIDWEAYYNTTILKY